MHKLVMAFALALTLGAGGVGLVQAQSFGIFFGDEPSDFEQEFLICLTDGQIRRAVAARGYADIALNVPNDSHVQVRASRDGWVYLLDFNYCTGRVEGRQRLRPAG